MTPLERNYRLAELVRAAHRRIVSERHFPLHNRWREIMGLVPGGRWRN